MLKNNLAELRTKAGYNQRQFGKTVGVSRQTISSIERGSYNPSVSLALKIAAVLGLSVENVFFIREGTEALYCECCKAVCTEPVCPVCSSKKLREAKENDPVFLARKNWLEAGILEGVLTEKGIPFEKSGLLGRGMSLKVGAKLEHYDFYVPYGAYEKCTEILEDVFGGDDANDENLE